MSYAILRLEKLKSTAIVANRIAHNLRTTEAAAPHADPERRAQNDVLAGGSTTAEVSAAVAARLASAGKFRKDAVRALGLVLTTSPEFFKPARGRAATWNAWLDSSMQWLRDTFGPENVVSAVLHRDEATPHIQAIVTPIHGGKLRASHWVDGPQKMSALQDSYHAAVQSTGLRRGEKGSRARHVTLRRYYALVNRIMERVEGAKPAKPPTLPERGLLGRVSDDDWNRLAAELKQFGSEAARARAEALAGAMLAAGEVGREARRRADAVAAQAAEAEQRAKQAQQLVAQQRDQFNAAAAERQRLAAELATLQQQREAAQRELDDVAGRLRTLRAGLTDAQRRAGESTPAPRDTQRRPR